MSPDRKKIATELEKARKSAAHANGILCRLRDEIGESVSKASIASSMTVVHVEALIAVERYAEANINA